MPTTTERTRVITETTGLGHGLLIAEAEDGAYQPVAVVSTIREAREIAEGNLRGRMRRVQEGGDVMCPARYLVWAQDGAGDYATVAVIEA